MRFPEFSGEWKMATFGDIAKGFDYGMNAAAKSFDGNNKYIRITDIDEVSSQYLYDDVVSPDGELEDRYLVKENDILLARTGASTGKSYLYRNSDGKLYFAGFLIRANIYKHNSYFVFSQLHTLRYKKWISVMSARSGQPGINSQEYASFPVYTTSLQEEDKIATFLKLLDERIITQNKIIEDLKKLKSAIIDKSFCYPNESSPQKRFIGFTEEWHLVHLSDICQRVRTKNFNTQCTLVLTIAAQFGLVSQEEFFNKSVASDNLEGYYLLRKGDFAYNKSYSGDYAWGAVKRLECFSEGVLSPLYICFRPDTARIDSDFLAHYFESKKWYKGIADIAGEGARNHGLLNLSVIDYFKTLHRIPSIQEQKAIANALNKLTSKISIEKNLYDDLLLQRQHLLQQMFI